MGYLGFDTCVGDEVWKKEGVLVYTLLIFLSGMTN
jgi:hypothetical protein